MEQRVEGNIVGDDIEGAVPDVLLFCLVGSADAFFQEVLYLVVGFAALPVHAGVGPDVAGVPPAHEEVWVVAEDGWVTWGDDDVVCFWLAVDGVVDVGGFTFGEGNVDAKGCEGFLDQWGAVLDPVVVGAQEVEAGKAGFSEQRLGFVGVEE